MDFGKQTVGEVIKQSDKLCKILFFRNTLLNSLKFPDFEKSVTFLKREINLENIGATDGEFTVKLHYKGDESLNHNGIIDEISVTPNTGGKKLKDSKAILINQKLNSKF